MFSQTKQNSMRMKLIYVSDRLTQYSYHCLYTYGLERWILHYLSSHSLLTGRIQFVRIIFNKTHSFFYQSQLVYVRTYLIESHPSSLKSSLS